jgi:hypothetical protein
VIITHSSLVPDYDPHLVNVTGIVMVKLTKDEAWRLKSDPDYIDEVMRHANEHHDDLRYTVTGWQWLNSFGFEGGEVILAPEEWVAEGCGECGREVPCMVHE